MTTEEFIALPILPRDPGTFPPPALCKEGGYYMPTGRGTFWELTQRDGVTYREEVML